MSPKCGPRRKCLRLTTLDDGSRIRIRLILGGSLDGSRVFVRCERCNVAGLVRENLPREIRMKSRVYEPNPGGNRLYGNGYQVSAQVRKHGLSCEKTPPMLCHSRFLLCVFHRLLVQWCDDGEATRLVHAS